METKNNTKTNLPIGKKNLSITIEETLEKPIY